MSCLWWFWFMLQDQFLPGGDSKLNLTCDFTTFTCDGIFYTVHWPLIGEPLKILRTLLNTSNFPHEADVTTRLKMLVKPRPHRHDPHHISRAALRHIEVEVAGCHIVETFIYRYLYFYIGILMVNGIKQQQATERPSLRVSLRFTYFTWQSAFVKQQVDALPTVWELKNVTWR